jgi:hypothetical protein
MIDLFLSPLTLIEKGKQHIKLADVQQALFAAYDLKNAMTKADMRRPTENDNMGECLTEIIGFLEKLEKATENRGL